MQVVHMRDGPRRLQVQGPPNQCFEPSNRTGLSGQAAEIEAHAHLAAIVESSEDAIISKALDGTVMSWNAAAERIFGYTAQEMVGNSITILIPDEQADEEPEILRRIKGGQEVAHYETKRIRKDGNIIEVALTISPIKNREGVIIGASKIARDITERKRSERALAEAQVRLRQHADELEQMVAERTAKLEETVSVLDSFCHSIAHDLRAPLRALSGFSKDLQETHGAVLDQEGKQTLELITRAATRMDQLILDLLRLGRVSTAELTVETLRLDGVIDEALAVLAPEFKRTGAQLHLCQPLDLVHGNSVLLCQVFTNLLGNAIKFVRAGVPPEITVSTERRGKLVRIRVTDNGIGIRQAHIRKLFQPFLRLVNTDEYPGTGVGLAIVRKAVERLGGAVGVESEPGRGSCFWLDLPAVEAEEALVC